MLANIDIAKTIPWSSTAGTWLTFSREPNLHTVIDTTGNGHFKIDFFGDPSLSTTIGTRFNNDLSSAPADRTSRLNSQDTGRLKHLAAATTLLTALRLSAGFAAAAITGAAIGRTFKLNVLGHSTGSLFKRQRHLDLDISASARS